MDSEDRALASARLREAVWLGQGRADLIEPILANARVLRFAAGQWAQAEGDDEAGVMLVLSGSVQMFCQAPGGREVLIGQAGPGAAIGQTTRFGGGPRLVTVICQEESRLLQISDRALGRIGEAAPRIWEAISALLYLQLRNVLQILAEAAALPPRQRLASRIEMLSRAGSGSRSVRITQQALGEMVGLSRKATNAHLADFERRGLVRRAYGGLDVIDLRGLRRIAEE